MKKMFRVLFVSFSLVVLFTTMTFPGGSITFNTPTQGQTITHIGDRSTIPVNILYGFTTDPNYSNPNYQILYAPPYGTFQTTPVKSLPQWISATAGTYQWRIELWQWTELGQPIKTAEQTISFSVKYALNVMNCFTGGNIKLDNTQYTAPVTVQKLINDNISATAIEPQTNSGYSWIWNTSSFATSNWSRIKYQGALEYLNNTNDKNLNYAVLSDDNGAQLITNLKRQLNVNFQNNFTGVGHGGTLLVNGTQYNSPATGLTVVEQNPITATAQSQTINGIDYTFSSWNNSTTQNPNTFYPGDNSTISANFIGRPNTVSRNLHFNSSNPNQPITVLWYEHPNTNVTQYQIWRKVNDKKQGISSPVLIGIVNRGTLNFVDYDYSGTNLGYTDYMLWYDVKPYYSTEGTVSVDNYVSVFSNGMLAKQGKDNKGYITESVLENRMENYPNPFNPSTVITYQIVNQGDVSLKVYDCLGKEIAELVNEEQNSGSYKVVFNVNNLGSGIYFYRIVANGYTETKKMIRMK